MLNITATQTAIKSVFPKKLFGLSFKASFIIIFFLIMNYLLINNVANKAVDILTQLSEVNDKVTSLENRANYNCNIQPFDDKEHSKYCDNK